MTIDYIEPENKRQIMETLMKFLTDLNRNNNREWFNDNHQRYEESLEQMLFFTGVMIQEIHKFDPGIPLMSPKDCLFRIYRDVRFSNDKRPYKTHMGSYLAPGGRKSNRAGYYLHIQPGNSIIAGGIWVPEAEPLKALRMEIKDNPEEFLEILDDKKFKRYYSSIEGEKLKTAPKGFDKDFRHIDLLRYKSYSFSTRLSDDQVLNGDFIHYSVEACQALYPMNRFLNAALDKWL
ncbi:MAG: DUF2461 domain-containing protein [Mangrovibacterium sp.]